MFNDFLILLSHSLLQPLLLFFYTGILVTLLRVKFELPKAVYQGLTIFLLLAIGWHGGEELAGLSSGALYQAIGFMVLGFITNLAIGVLAYTILQKTARLRPIDTATVAGYYGSDSAGTYAIAMAVLTTAHIAFAPYMPVMLAVMEIPGCLVALYFVSELRANGIDVAGNMPGDREKLAAMAWTVPATHNAVDGSHLRDGWRERELKGEMVGSGARGSGFAWMSGRGLQPLMTRHGGQGSSLAAESQAMIDRLNAEELEATLALETSDVEGSPAEISSGRGFSNSELFSAVFLNPGVFLLFAGLTMGWITRLQGKRVMAADDALFTSLFQGVLCLLLLEMGMTATSKLRDLRSADWRFVAFGLWAPNLFAGIGLMVAHLYSLFLGRPFEVGTYVLFAVLCGSASYIALPAVQRMAIREASPTLPLASALGLTFFYNVTIGIPVYLLMANLLMTCLPVLSI